MAKIIMIQGTASNVGKSVLVAGLCRIFKQDGYSVAPFKSQNMALNSFITSTGHEMGRAQVMQAEASGIEPDVRMNPILLKPTTDRASQVIVNGVSIGNMSAAEYFAYKKKVIPSINSAYDSLSQQFDIIVLEGAGSPAEINLKVDDIVNMGMAKMANAPVLLVGDIDRGGVFASIAGTMLLLDDDEKELVKGVIINKFRGDKEILMPGLAMLEDIIKRPTVGVVPYFDIKLDDEDSLTNRFHTHAQSLIDIAVLRLPKISNFTDFNPFEYIDGVGVRYITSVAEFGKPDLVIIPGSKNTIADLLWLNETGLAKSIINYAANCGAMIGICGGYQILGKTINDPHGVEHGGSVDGLGLLSIDTLFEKEKHQTQINGILSAVNGIFKAISDLPYRGYEIHMGKSRNTNNIIGNGNIYGTYIHGLFDNKEIITAIAQALFDKKGIARSVIAKDINEHKKLAYDELADVLRKNLNMASIYKILEQGM